jgi:hypothetical protein
MKTFLEYITWLNEIKGKTIDEKTLQSIQRLIILLMILEAKKVFEKDNSIILRRLDSLMKNVEQEPLKTKRFMDSCFSDVMNITSKFHSLVRKNHYQNEWTAYGMSFGIILGVLIYTLTNDVAFIVVGLPIGLSLGLGIGTMLDKKAVNEGRILNIQ